MNGIKLTEIQVNEILDELKSLTTEFEEIRNGFSLNNTGLARTFTGSTDEERMVEIKETLKLKTRLLNLNRIFKNLSVL